MTQHLHPWWWEPHFPDDFLVQLVPTTPAPVGQGWPKGVEIYTSAFSDSSCCHARYDRICRRDEHDLYVCSRCGELCDPVPQA